MIIDFKKIKILYTFIMPFFVLVALVVFYLTKNLAYPVLIFLGALLMNNYLFRILLERQYNKMDKALYNECDSEKYLRSVDASIVAAKASRMYGPGTQVAVLTRKATALVNLGRFKEARDALSKAKVSKKSIVAKAEYYNSLIPCFSSTKDAVGEAQKYLDEMKKIIDDPAFPKGQKAISDQFYNLHRYTIDAQRGQNTKKAIEYFENMLEITSDKYSLVKFNYLLGLCYSTDKQTDKAKECFNYSVENGNTLFVVTQAKKALEKLK